MIDFFNQNIVSALLGATVFAFISNIFFLRYSNLSNKVSDFKWFNNFVSFHFHHELNINLEKIKKFRQKLSQELSQELYSLDYFAESIIFLDETVISLLVSKENIKYINPEIANTFFIFYKKIKKINEVYYFLFDRLVRGELVHRKNFIFLNKFIDELEKDIIFFIEMSENGFLLYGPHDGYITRKEKWKSKFSIWFFGTILKKG